MFVHALELAWGSDFMFLQYSQVFIMCCCVWCFHNLIQGRSYLFMNPCVCVPPPLQYWSGEDRDIHHHRPCPGAEGDRGSGGHPWSHTETQTTENYDGPDSGIAMFVNLP